MVRMASDESTADLILTGGAVHTVDGANRIVEAMAVSKGRVLATGATSDIERLAGTGTVKIDLQGRPVLPGMIDAHGHFAGLGATNDLVNCKPAHVRSIREIVAAIRDRCTETPKGQWVRSRGYDQFWLEEGRHPTRADLDEAAPEHPVVLTRTCGHIVTFNSRAMEQVGVTEDVADPDGGRYERSSDGRVAGIAFERAGAPFRDVVKPSPEDMRRHLRLANRAFLSNGLTGVHDVGGLLGPYLQHAQDLVESGDLKVRLYAGVHVNTMDHPLIPILDTGIRSGLGDERLRIGVFKVMTDGASSGPSASTREPYAIDPNDRGIAYWRQEELDDLIGRAHRAGWQCTVHAVGDAAIEQTLNAMARAQKEHPRKNLRHRIDHCAMVPPDLQDRIVAQGIVPSMQPVFFWEFGDGYIRNYGRTRADYMFPAASLAKRDVVIAGGSDTPVTDHNPMLGISEAMTRLTMNGDVCGPEEKVDLDTAIRFHTINAAYASFDEGIKGSLEPGKLADFVILDRDLRGLSPHDVRDVRVDATYVDGIEVYSRGG